MRHALPNLPVEAASLRNLAGSVFIEVADVAVRSGTLGRASGAGKVAGVLLLRLGRFLRMG
jgi:hypothetical protein